MNFNVEDHGFEELLVSIKDKKNPLLRPGSYVKH